MKILLNRGLEGFHIPDEIEELGYSVFNFENNKVELIDFDNDDCYHKVRLNKDLIKLYEESPQIFSKDIQLFEIPDNSFYKVSNYDGYETLYYSKTEIKEV